VVVPTRGVFILYRACCRFSLSWLVVRTVDNRALLPTITLMDDPPRFIVPPNVSGGILVRLTHLFLLLLRWYLLFLLPHSDHRQGVSMTYDISFRYIPMSV